MSTRLTLIVACVLARGPSRLLFGISAFLTMLVLVVTIRFELPLNKHIPSWTPSAAPPVWE